MRCTRRRARPWRTRSGPARARPSDVRDAGPGLPGGAPEGRPAVPALRDQDQRDQGRRLRHVVLPRLSALTRRQRAVERSPGGVGDLQLLADTDPPRVVDAVQPAGPPRRPELARRCRRACRRLRPCRSCRIRRRRPSPWAAPAGSAALGERDRRRAARALAEAALGRRSGRPAAEPTAQASPVAPATAPGTGPVGPASGPRGSPRTRATIIVDQRRRRRRDPAAGARHAEAMRPWSRTRGARSRAAGRAARRIGALGARRTQLSAPRGTGTVEVLGREAQAPLLLGGEDAGGVTAVQRWARAWRGGAPGAIDGHRYGQTAGVAVTARIAAWNGATGSAIIASRIPACRQADRRACSARKRKNPGDDLFSRKAALSVSSALESLTSVFGMGTGMASPPVSPGFVASGCVRLRPMRGPESPRGRRNEPSISIFESSQTWIDHDIPATDPRSVAVEVKPSTVSTAQLHPSPNFHMRPIKQVVSLRSYPVDPVGNLISRRASHLDAFSAYPDRT